MGNDIQFKTVKVKSLMKPRWWQFRLRYRLWKIERERTKFFKSLSPREREMVNSFEREIERNILFGDSDDDTKEFK